jgi:DNA replication and repair protein RecF
MLAIAEQLHVDAPSCIAVTRLKLTAFRCYDGLQLDLDTRPVMLTGPNGAGKTNLLEAISYLAPGRGLRGAQLAEADRRGATRPWAMAATVATAVGSIDVGTGHDSERKRRSVHINGAPARGPAALAEYVSAIWLTPQMDRLFREGASARRRFLDRFIYGFHAAHASRVAAYEHAIRERIRLLRDGRGERSWLDAIESEIAEHGVAIAAVRVELAERLERACEAASGPFSGASIDVDGTLESWLSENPALAVEDRFKEVLARNRATEAETGNTAIGPHRSDLIVRHRAKGLMASQCSTGEQKALLIAVLLANARLQASERGFTPLLLLDEAAAHLDASRRSALFDEILGLGAQAWFSGTDEDLFTEFGGSAQFIRITDGTAQKF